MPETPTHLLAEIRDLLGRVLGSPPQRDTDAHGTYAGQAGPNFGPAGWMRPDPVGSEAMTGFRSGFSTPGESMQAQQATNQPGIWASTERLGHALGGQPARIAGMMGQFRSVVGALGQMREALSPLFARNKTEAPTLRGRFKPPPLPGRAGRYHTPPPLPRGANYRTGLHGGPGKTMMQPGGGVPVVAQIVKPKTMLAPQSVGPTLPKPKTMLAPLAVEERRLQRRTTQLAHQPGDMPGSVLIPPPPAARLLHRTTVNTKKLNDTFGVKPRRTPRRPKNVLPPVSRPLAAGGAEGLGTAGGVNELIATMKTLTAAVERLGNSAGGSGMRPGAGGDVATARSVLAGAGSATTGGGGLRQSDNNKLSTPNQQKDPKMLTAGVEAAAQAGIDFLTGGWSAVWNTGLEAGSRYLTSVVK